MFNQTQAIAWGARVRATNRLSAATALSILAATLVGCGAPAPKEYGGSWTPVNRFQSAATEIPLSPAYTFYASPMDATLRTMLKRWASDNGLQLGGNDNSTIFAIQGKPGAALSKFVDVPTVESMHTPVAQSSQAFTVVQQAHQQAPQQNNHQAAQQTAPAMSR